MLKVQPGFGVIAKRRVDSIRDTNVRWIVRHTATELVLYGDVKERRGPNSRRTVDGCRERKEFPRENKVGS